MKLLVNKKLVTLCAFLDKLYEKGIVTNYFIARGFNDTKDLLDEGNLSIDFVLAGFKGTIGVYVYPDRYHIIDCRLGKHGEIDKEFVTIKDLAKTLREELEEA